MIAAGPSPIAHKGVRAVAEPENIVRGGINIFSGRGGEGRHGSVMVKYHTFQTRGQGFEPLCKHFFPIFKGA